MRTLVRLARLAPPLITLNGKSVVERGPLVGNGSRDAIIRFGPRPTRYVPDLRQSVSRRLRLEHNLRGQIGCWCRRDGVMGGDYLRRDWRVAFPKNSNATSAKPTNAKKERAGIAIALPLRGAIAEHQNPR